MGMGKREGVVEGEEGDGQGLNKNILLSVCF